MLFVNLTATKPNGDFAITSSDVLSEKHPDLSFAEIYKMLLRIGNEYEIEGYQVSWNVEDF
jgi:hypothetical protein